MNDELFQITGVCKYCGQRQILQSEEKIDTEKANDIATSKCNCPTAKKEQNRLSKILKANEWVDNRFENTPEVIKFFKQTIEAVTNNEIDQVSIKRNGWTYTLKLTPDNFLNVKCKKNLTEEEDFN